MSFFELGIFLPNCNHGWILSTSAPEAPATFELNKSIAVLAEQIGLDFLLAQSVWRGHGGATRFWDDSLECFSLMSALAAVTEKLGIIASVQPLLYPPAVAAKMTATIDEISRGRFGINLVAGSHFQEYAQMGLLPEGFSDYRYDYATEWIQTVKRLWAEEKVTVAGKWHQLDQCVCGPKPLQQPHPPIVCAGTSPRGMAFTAAEGTHAFIAAPTLEKMRELRDRYVQTAEELGRSLKVYTAIQIIPGESDEMAQQRVEEYCREPDWEALADFHGQYSKSNVGVSMKEVAASSTSVFFGSYLAGGRETISNYVTALAQECLLDGLLLTFPDWLPDMNWFAEQIMPPLQEKGILRTGSAAKWGFSV